MNAKRTILIVDDDPKLRKTLSGILQAKGYAPLAAATGKAALDRVEEEMPAVALIDLRLEDMSGLEVMGEIKERSPDTECIVLTGYATQKSAIEAVNLGAYSYVQKPYDMEQLLVTVRRAIEKREGGEALRASEEKYRVLVDNANEAIIVVQDGMLKFVNPKAMELTGYSKEELTSRPFVEFIYPGDQERVIERHLKRLKGEELPHVYSFRIIDKDGNIRCAEINAVLITWESRPATLNFLSDITERKRAEEELQQSYVKLQRALEGTVNTLVSAIEMRDPYTGHHQRRVTRLACAIAREMGLPEEQIEGLRMAGLIHDLGKITIPAVILSKSTRLNDLEWGMIQTHPKVG